MTEWELIVVNFWEAVPVLAGVTLLALVAFIVWFNYRLAQAEREFPEEAAADPVDPRTGITESEYMWSIK